MKRLIGKNMLSDQDNLNDNFKMDPIHNSNETGDAEL